MEFDRTCFAPSRAKWSNVIPIFVLLVASTNLKRDASNTEDSLRDWAQLKGVNVLLASMREN